jgi:Holliday junction DNA helicase RuvA
MELFGFFTEEEEKAFELLITVSGVGPKAGISILSVLTPDRLSSAILSGDAKAIAKANGVGAKTAARVVLELKDKIGKLIPPVEGGTVLPEESSMEDNSSLGDALSALTVLGYSRQEAFYALRGLPADADTETLIRAALKKLLKNG